jgi:hypothetical protein
LLLSCSVPCVILPDGVAAAVVCDRSMTHI